LLNNNFLLSLHNHFTVSAGSSINTLELQNVSATAYLIFFLKPLSFQTLSFLLYLSGQHKSFKGDL